ARAHGCGYAAAARFLCALAHRRLRLDRSHALPSSHRSSQRHRHQAGGAAAASATPRNVLNIVFMHWSGPMKSIASAVAVFLLAITAAIAQVGPQEADHAALRKLKDDVLTAINTRNLAAVDAMLHKPFLSTVITQESFNETGKLRGWFDDLFARPRLRLRHFRIQAEADEMAQIYTGTFAVARGSTKERYELADGR